MKEIAQAILSAELKAPACWFEDEHYAAFSTMFSGAAFGMRTSATRSAVSVKSLFTPCLPMRSTPT